jgi:hypothetical protein
MPITRKEFEKRSINLENEIVDFLNAHRDRAYTSEEIMNATSFHTEFDLISAPEITVFIVSNFVAFINDLAARGRIRRKVVNNRMYFTAVEVKYSRVGKKKRMERKP